MFEFFDDRVERVETFGPELAIAFDPGCLVGQGACTQPAGADTADLLGGDEARLFEHAHMLFHAGERHAEAVGELGDRCVRPHQLFEHAAPCRVGQGGERIIEMRLKLNHIVQYQHLWIMRKGDKRALLSVFDKSDMADFAKELTPLDTMATWRRPVSAR